MDITKKIDQDGIESLVLTLPLNQISYDAVGTATGEVPNLIGVIAGDRFTISQLNDLGYKGDQQEGSPYILFDFREDLEEVCERFGLSIWEHPVCAYCKEAIRSSFTLGDLGNMCWNCELALTSKKKGV